MTEWREDKFSLSVLWAVAWFMFLAGALTGGAGLVGAMFAAHWLFGK